MTPAQQTRLAALALAGFEFAGIECGTVVAEWTAPALPGRAARVAKRLQVSPEGAVTSYRPSPACAQGRPVLRAAA